MSEVNQQEVETAVAATEEPGAEEPVAIPPIYISEEKLAELKDVFGMFDNGAGKAATSDLGDMVRAVGRHPTEAEVAAWMMDVDKSGNGSFEFSEFQNLMATKMGSSSPEDDIRNAFITFDKEGTGTIPAATLREIMLTMGEVLSKEEVEEMIQIADTDNDGIIHYEEFLAILLTS